jgi:hypothetical protein
MDNNGIAALLGTTQCLVAIGCSVLNLVVIVACIVLAQKKNRSALWWGLLGLFFSIFALFVLLLLPTVERRWPVAYAPPPPVPYPPAPYAAPPPMPYAPQAAPYAAPPAAMPYAPQAAPYPAPPSPLPTVSYPAAPAATVIQGAWRLTVLQGADAGQSFALGVQARLGRNSDNEVRLNDPQASRYHALIQRQQNAYLIIDQGSGNGTYVNGQLINRPTPLASGDVITIGNTQIKVG